MVAVPLGLSAYRRQDANTPEILLRNMLVEKDPSNLIDGWVRLQRPGLTAFATAGTGPIRGIHKTAGVFGGDWLVVSAGELYRVTEAQSVALLGSISGIDRVQIAMGTASGQRAIIATGGLCYSTNGVNVVQVNMPGAVLVQSVTYLNGYFLLSVTGTQRIYFLAPGDVDPDPLNFFSAESSPDNIVCLKRIGDEFWAFGDSSIQPFAPTGDSDIPFSPVQGRTYQKGCANRDTVVEVDNTLFWVGADDIAYRGDSVPIRISDNGIEEALRNADGDTLRAWGFTYNGHTIYCLTIGDAGTFFYDVSVPSWGQFNTYERTIWRAHLGAQTDGSLIVAGDDRTGDLWRLNADSFADDDDPIVRELLGSLPVVGSSVPCSVFSVYTTTGRANLNYPGDNPVMQMRHSDDGGNNWSDWINMPLGRSGAFSGEVPAWRLGLMRNPSKLFHLRMSEPLGWRVSYARVNEYSPQ